MLPERIRLAAIVVAMSVLAAASASGARWPTAPASPASWETARASAAVPISARVSLGCQHSEGFVARVLAEAGERSASRFTLGSGFVAVYRDGSWIHVAELAQPCIVASGARADMITYFAIE